MAIHDRASQRLFTESPLQPDGEVELGREAANYLLNVLRLGAGAEILVFNGRDGEWRASLLQEGRRAARLRLVERTREQTGRPDLDLLFAPLKHARLDYLAQKAVEMGAGTIQPVFTRRTVPNRVNSARLQANVIEAAEQCGILALPELRPEQDLPAALAGLEPGRPLLFCDEAAPVANPVEALAGLPRGGGVALLIGPEGGFDPEERAAILARPLVVRLSLGPRVMRADTAAVAALAVVQAVLGDWR
ncbi:16S rRNA (uracil(1498)-N(3))-methyltransferase [Enterovirga sp.]|uniref:16S rRNA (uracil(1498)-N(3))-methyltransferase n=1 Tax=Enterovirga sp. TaxID=2026350 RepID=UPI00262BD8A1|nr:16S rRNA (uracil(1498)-N(3))-methyltransferase [Enterovirga sp.]MDB5592608.1 rRNA ((1498)-N(3))-methyltransferase [Enterovirga sp.]